MQMQLPDRFPTIAIEKPVANALACGIRASLLTVILLVYSFNSGPVKAENLAAPADKQAAEKASAPASTDGVASPSDRVSPTAVPTLRPVTSALPDRPMAVTGEPAMLPQGAFANADSAQEPAVTGGTGVKTSVKRSTAKRAR